jgi:hypothetical protein
MLLKKKTSSNVTKGAIPYLLMIMKGGNQPCMKISLTDRFGDVSISYYMEIELIYLERSSCA